ncbi:MAG: phenylacetate-CoA oxygenase subunit PaaJ [Crocinitomicaceae bacterium]|tara:strand:- start:368 stop:853 length:486 start_codon:yes stop_codon:yes gene_type:complete
MVNENIIWAYLEDVYDPEVPVLSIVDLGIVRSAKFENNHVDIVITPTYTGCPAMQTIEQDIIVKLKSEGIFSYKIETSIAPAWTTDWMSEAGKQKLKEYGIAPPQDEVDKSVLFADPLVVPCPKCEAQNTKLVSQFGSTACKAHYQCKECREPFDYFKCLR